MSATTAVEATTATAVEATASTAATESAAAANCNVTAVPATLTAANEPASPACVSAAASIAVSATPVCVPPTTVAITIASTVSISNSAAIEPATEPGTGADEESAIKPFRAVVSVGRARIRSIVVVAIGTSRRSIRNRWPISVTTHADAYRNLRVRICCGNKQDREQQSHNLEIPHCPTSWAETGPNAHAYALSIRTPNVVKRCYYPSVPG